MDPLPDKRILIITGPNGVGKTTLALELLPGEANIPTFINACSLPAFGQEGLHRERLGFDGLVQAMGSGMSVTGNPGQPPVFMASPSLHGGPQHRPCLWAWRRGLLWARQPNPEFIRKSGAAVDFI